MEVRAGLVPQEGADLAENQGDPGQDRSSRVDASARSLVASGPPAEGLLGSLAEVVAELIRRGELAGAQAVLAAYRGGR